MIKPDKEILYKELSDLIIKIAIEVQSRVCYKFWESTSAI